MPSGVRLRLKVIPNARRNQVVGWRGGLLTVKLTAPPVEGKANRELVSFLAEVMGVPASDVEILSGETARSKSVSVLGVTPEQARERIGQRLGPD